MSPKMKMGKSIWDNVLTNPCRLDLQDYQASLSVIELESIARVIYDLLVQLMIDKYIGVSPLTIKPFLQNIYINEHPKSEG